MILQGGIEMEHRGVEASEELPHQEQQEPSLNKKIERELLTKLKDLPAEDAAVMVPLIIQELRKKTMKEAQNGQCIFCYKTKIFS